MKRYSLTTSVSIWRDNGTLSDRVESIAHMNESGNGQWVRAEEAQKVIDDLEVQIPEKRILKLERALGLVSEGRCPECERMVRDWKAPTGSFAPEAWATLKENGIDAHTGHKFTCSRAHK